MEKKNILSVIAFLTLLVLTTSALAMWSETLRINATINTGEVDVEFSDYACSDKGPDPQAPGFDNSEGKDVATCLVEPESYDDEEDLVKLKVTLENAYPGYAPTITFYVKNIGTIPVKLLSYNINELNSTALSASLVIPIDTQLHPEDEGEYSLYIVVNQEADELATYTFEVVLVFAQWNEIPSQSQ